MKKTSLIFFLLFGVLTFAQMPNIEKVWLNKNNFYLGNISDKKVPLKIKIVISEQDKKNDQEYFVSGISIVENTLMNFEGKIKINKYKDGKKQSSVYGEYEFAEENKGKHSGIFKGKFIFTFTWNKKLQTIENHYLEFIGDWESYDRKLLYKTHFKNQ